MAARPRGAPRIEIAFGGQTDTVFIARSGPHDLFFLQVALDAGRDGRAIILRAVTQTSIVLKKDEKHYWMEKKRSREETEGMRETNLVAPGI
jgi:hypothetical protein